MDEDRAVVLRRAELRERGVSAWRERRRVERGEWTRLYGGLVALGPAGPADVVDAALLAAAPDVALTADSGAQLWLGREVVYPVQLAVPHGRRFRDSAQVQFHQVRAWVPPVLHEGLPVLPAAQVAAAVAAGSAREADRRALVTALVHAELTTADEVAVAAAGTAKRARGQVRRTVEELLAGAHSGPEATLWRSIVEARMPVPVLNHPLRGGARSLDGYREDLRAGYEVQSAAHHAATWLEDTRRLAEILVQDQIVLLPILVSDIDHRIERVLGDLEGFWRNRARELGVPYPRFVAPPRWEPGNHVSGPWPP